MTYKLKTNISLRANYGSKRKKSDIKNLVFHYTGNDCDTDEGNANYFHNNFVDASAHAFIDDDSVTISVKDEYVAWAVGSEGLLDQGSAYAKKGGKMFGKVTNTNSYSIELCDTKKDGKHSVSAKTRANAISYGAKKMVELNIDIDHVYRHFDVNGKLCPIYWVTNESDWKNFKKELQVEYERLLGVKKIKKPYAGTFPTLPKRGYFKKGDKGVQVGNLQKFLNWALDCDLKIDKDLGDQTESKVKVFQKKYKLVIDGEFGQKCLEKAISIKK